MLALIDDEIWCKSGSRTHAPVAVLNCSSSTAGPKGDGQPARIRFFMCRVRSCLTLALRQRCPHRPTCIDIEATSVRRLELQNEKASGADTVAALSPPAGARAVSSVTRYTSLASSCNFPPPSRAALRQIRSDCGGACLMEGWQDLVMPSKAFPDGRSPILQRQHLTLLRNVISVVFYDKVWRSFHIWQNVLQRRSADAHELSAISLRP